MRAGVRSSTRLLAELQPVIIAAQHGPSMFIPVWSGSAQHLKTRASKVLPRKGKYPPFVLAIGRWPFSKTVWETLWGLLRSVIVTLKLIQVDESPERGRRSDHELGD